MKLRPLLISFSLLAFTGASYAQQQQKEQMNEKQTQSTTQSQSSQGGTSASGSASQSAQKDEQRAAAGASGSQQSQRGMTIDQVKDIDIVDGQGKELGKIEDVVVDLSSGKVHAAVLSFGGFMGVGEKHYAFQPTELQRGKEQNQLVLNVDKQKLENAEGFEKGQWPGMDDEYWRNVGGKQAGAAGGGQSRQMNLIRASELEGKEVQDQSGNKVGEVQDVMMDLTQGQVRNIAVNVEGGGRAMVPAKSIKATGTEDRLVLDMDAQQLKQQAQRSGGQRQRGAAGGTMDEKEAK
ncbi:MAG TPA: PRC-barrel domain-containing protein [Burkholderiales bacterium]|nr:PRC-barrel domain-containing protein [Burkholderiales bacterium]